MAVTTKAKGGREDLNLYNGKSKTFSRLDSTGGSQTITKINDFVDVLQVYGSGANYTVGTLDAAIKAVGSSNVELFLSAGNWVIDSNFSFPSTATLVLEHGCYFTISSGITLTLNGPLRRTRYNTFRGSGSYTLSELTKNSLPVVQHSTTVTAKADTTLIIGEVAHIRYYSGTILINADYDVVATATGTHDDFEYHSDDGSAGGSVSQLKLRVTGARISVKLAGATGDGTTNDYPAFNRVYTYLAANRGGVIYVPAGTYSLESEFVIDYPGITLQGEGTGNFVNQTPTTTAPTQLTINQTTGAGVWLKQQGCAINDMRIMGGTTRYAAAYSINLPGVRIEPADTSSARADRAKIYRCRIDRHPGDGILTSGSVTGTDIQSNDVLLCKGMGIRLDSGQETGRTNKLYPGLIDVIQCRVGYCGGHAVAVSSPNITSASETGVRVVIEQLDAYGNADDAAVRYTNYTVFMFGETCEIRNSGVAGNDVTLVGEQHGGVYIMGRYNKLLNNRYIETSQPIQWDNSAILSSIGLVVDGIRNFQTAATITDLITVDSACTGLRVYYDEDSSSGDYTNIVTTTFDDAMIMYRGSLSLPGTRMKAGNYSTGRNLSIADDSVATIQITDFSTFASGMLHLSSTQITSGGGVFQFRVGTSPGTLKFSGQSTTVAFTGGGSGALAGTTGTDTELTVSSHTDGLIYIENRLGFAVSLEYFITCGSGTSHAGAGQ